MVEKYKNAVRSLWTAKCTVSVYENVDDEATGSTKQILKPIYTDEPCRLSFKTVEITAENSHAAKKVQKPVLYIGSEVNIPEGSRITVTQLGVTRTYERSGVSAVYSAHQEVPLILVEEWT